MESYDQIEGFEYWNVEAWRDFVREYILPLHESASKLLGLRELLISIKGTEETTLSKVEKKEKALLPFLLGGINEVGDYKDNSFAKIIRSVLGVYVNPKEWVTLEKEEGLVASDYVKVKTEGSIFSEFLTKINEVTSNILKLVKIEPTKMAEKEIRTMISNPSEIVDAIRYVYTKSLEVSANHNYYTFFVISVRSIPFKFLIGAYPKLNRDFSSLSTFLGIEKVFEPKLNEADEKLSYAIFGHSKGGFCDLLNRLNQVIWEYFAKEDIKNVFSYISASLENLKQEFIQKVEQKLKEVNWSFPSYIRTTDRRYYLRDVRGVYRYRYVISGPLLVKELSDGTSHRGNWYSNENKCNINLLKLLDDLSPALFLGLPSFELKISDNTLEIVK